MQNQTKNLDKIQYVDDKDLVVGNVYRIYREDKKVRSKYKKTFLKDGRYFELEHKGEPKDFNFLLIDKLPILDNKMASPIEVLIDNEIVFIRCFIGEFFEHVTNEDAKELKFYNFFAPDLNKVIDKISDINNSTLQIKQLYYSFLGLAKRYGLTEPAKIKELELALKPVQEQLNKIQSLTNEERYMDMINSVNENIGKLCRLKYINYGYGYSGFLYSTELGVLSEANNFCKCDEKDTIGMIIEQVPGHLTKVLWQQKIVYVDIKEVLE